ncbi:hypothetical protein D3Z17_09695 [Bacillus subtilis]|uniref:hypothetical protein n=1 Tax=Bacillus subtilis TaxID=1423 RepID=UPI000EA117EB|nr:hypothetical protein [Bacillus subtilis]UNY48681.1 hypothetical protein spr_160 [Bacillus phage SPR]WIT27735.1 hypothetical protein [Bacillus phage SPbetaL5]AYF11368.1 hypothetical protein D3Z17_09695 [Bacillus subtilis]MED5590612.1 hypothetical protein [Bacillus subtilis]QPF43800.1 hypothetical protein GO004_04310 [Bacillus subtilis]
MLKLKFRNQTLELRRKMSLQLHRLLEDMTAWSFNENEAQKYIDEYELELVEKSVDNKFKLQIVDKNKNIWGELKPKEPGYIGYFVQTE